MMRGRMVCYHCDSEVGPFLCRTLYGADIKTPTLPELVYVCRECDDKDPYLLVRILILGPTQSPQDSNLG